MRLDGWERRFNDLIDERMNCKLVWGEHDCCMFVADSVKAITGNECAGFSRGKYSNKIGAYRKLKEYAGGGISEMMNKIAEEYSLNEVGVNYAGRGDVALCVVDTHIGDDVEVLGVLTGDGRIMIAGRDGLVANKKSVGVKFWKI